MCSIPGNKAGLSGKTLEGLAEVEHGALAGQRGARALLMARQTINVIHTCDLQIPKYLICIHNASVIFL